MEQRPCAPHWPAYCRDLQNQGHFRQSFDGENCLIQTVLPVEKRAKTSQAPREKSTEVGNPPKPPQALRCASVATQTNPRPLRSPQQSSEPRLWSTHGLLRSGKRASRVGNGASNLYQTVSPVEKSPKLPWPCRSQPHRLHPSRSTSFAPSSRLTRHDWAKRGLLGSLVTLPVRRRCLRGDVQRGSIYGTTTAATRGCNAIVRRCRSRIRSCNCLIYTLGRTVDFWGSIQRSLDRTSRKR